MLISILTLISILNIVFDLRSAVLQLIANQKQKQVLN